jgi:hypothetical protein
MVELIISPEILPRNSTNPDILCPNLQCEAWHYPGNFHFQGNQIFISNNWFF